jgi:hypothetical protein
MADEVPRLADWLAEYRARPAPVEVVMCEAAATDPEVPTMVGVKVIRYDKPANPVPTGGYYLIGYDSSGADLFDLWFETLADALDDAADRFGLDEQDWSQRSG